MRSAGERPNRVSGASVAGFGSFRSFCGFGGFSRFSAGFLFAGFDLRCWSCLSCWRGSGTPPRYSPGRFFIAPLLLLLLLLLLPTPFSVAFPARSLFLAREEDTASSPVSGLAHMDMHRRWPVGKMCGPEWPASSSQPKAPPSEACTWQQSILFLPLKSLGTLASDGAFQLSPRERDEAGSASKKAGALGLRFSDMAGA